MPVAFILLRIINQSHGSPNWEKTRVRLDNSTIATIMLHIKKLMTCLKGEVLANSILGSHNLIHFINACNCCEQKEIILCESLLWSHYCSKLFTNCNVGMLYLPTCEYLCHIVNSGRFHLLLSNSDASQKESLHDNQLHIAGMQQTQPMTWL